VKVPSALLAAIAVLLVGSASRAQAPYQLQRGRELWLVGAGTAVGVTALWLIDQVEPLTPDEIAALNPDDVNSFDRGAIGPWREVDSGDRLLTVSYFLPLTFLIRPDTRHDWRTLGLMWGEALLIQAAVNGVAKGAVERTRPYVYDSETPMDKKTTTNARLSFYSGHTGTAAVTCFFIARVFDAYLENWKARALLWTGAAAYPAVVGYLRRDSANHFYTDVITGYVVGAAIGILVPHFHRAGEDDNVSLGGAVVGGRPGLALRLRF
jgi:membrane-associated phospholipid phosphatase